ncbi:MAG: hypothetical protein EP341_07990 [Sphingomonadales bacterium]|nr:MAG: hypothetical protein EP341_07990 [Sphingomonadales bacterium]
MSLSKGNRKENLTLILQVATLLGVMVSAILGHYSQKSLIEYKAEIERKEPRIFGTVVHAFLPEKYSEYNEVELTNVRVMDGGKLLGETMYLEDHLVNYPVQMALSIENRGNLKADDISIEVTTPAGSLMRGRMTNIKYPYEDCSHNEENSNFRILINCKSLKQGESRSFNFLWLPGFFSKDIERYELNRTFSTSVKTDDFVEAKAYIANGPEAIILKGSIHLASTGEEANKGVN